MRALWMLGALFGVSAASAAPMTHQGRLVDASGTPINGSFEVVVSLVEGDGDVAFTEAHTTTFENGYYAVRLGTIETLDAGIFDEPLDVRISLGGVVSGEQPLTSVPSALSVDGRVRVSGSGGVCDADRAGALHYAEGRLQLCDGTSWLAFAGKRSVKPMSLLVNGNMNDEEGNFAFTTTDAVRFVEPASEGTHSLSALVYGSTGTSTPDWAAQSQPDAQWALSRDLEDWALEWDYRHTGDNGYERILFATSTEWADNHNGWCPGNGSPSKFLSQGWMVCSYWTASRIYFHGTGGAVSWPYVGYHSDWKRLRLVHSDGALELFVDGVSQGVRAMPNIVSTAEPVLYLSGSGNGSVTDYNAAGALSMRSQMDDISFGPR